MMYRLILFSVIVFLQLSSFGWSEPAANKKGIAGLAAGCSPATALAELAINNIKTQISTGGDFWWNQSASYEVPKGSGKHSMYAGALWLGGQDISGQLKVAGMVYRVNGNDFWPGPLSTITAEITSETCSDYDKHFVTTRDMVAEHVGWYAAGEYDLVNGTTTQADNFPGYSISNAILEWPAHGRNYDPYNEDYNLAPFTDLNGNGIYEPLSGDYPGYDIKGDIDCSDRKLSIYGDYNLWWVFNDKGNIHTSTQSNSIGMEIRAQAFGFATNDEVNSMTFMNFELINRSTFTLTETYFGIFADTDIGGYEDDYVGCDVMKGLSYCYNGDNDDQDFAGASGYLNQPPAIGIDFFEGPYQDNDGIDNNMGIDFNEALNGVGYGDSIVDNERFGMRRFVYFNRLNTGPAAMQDPTLGSQYYNYLRGLWKNGNPMVFGGTGYTQDGSGLPTNFMFPGDSDSLNWGTNGVDPGYSISGGWTEENEQNPVGDRRFIQSAGPFTLTPGAVNDITVGLVWSQAENGNAFESVRELLIADVKTQAMFDNCFRVLDGPEAPELTFQEMDQTLILYLSNSQISNNYNEQYAERSPFITAPASIDTDGDGIADYTLTQAERDEYSTYRFQGYKVYQIKDNTVDVASLDDLDKARLIFQCDKQDSIARIINFYFDKSLGSNIPVEEVNGANVGISHSILVTDDQFATGDKRLVNHKTYCFMAVSYAYNNYKTYDPANPESDAQMLPYIGSRKAAVGAINPSCAIPHKTSVEAGGTFANATYGDVVEITRIEGIGNSGSEIKLTDASIDQIMAGEPWKVANPVYQKGFTPITVKVIDPLNVSGTDFTVKFKDWNTTSTLDDATWVLYDSKGDSVAGSDGTIQYASEHLLFDYGISISLRVIDNPTDLPPSLSDNGYISSEMVFEDPLNQWLGGVPDVDGSPEFDWILVGSATEDRTTSATGSAKPIDPDQVYEGVMSRTWGPGYVAAPTRYGPFPPVTGDAYFQAAPGIYDGLAFLHGIDVIMTADKTKWTRCPVLEMQFDSTVSSNGQWKCLLRLSPSVDKEGLAYTGWNSAQATTSGSASTSSSAANYIAPYGMGWFPGYAIDVETGERLNMAFGEDSWLINENGRDMLWNPTSNITEGVFGDVRGGGMHYIYVFRNNEVEEDMLKIGPPAVVAYNNQKNRMPAYDYGKFSFDMLANAEYFKRTTTQTGTVKVTNVYKELTHMFRASMWIGFPLLNPASTLLSSNVTTRIRVNRDFERYGSAPALDHGATPALGISHYVNQGPISYNGVAYDKGDVFTPESGDALTTIIATSDDSIGLVIPTQNDALPMYQFNISHLAATKDSLDLAKDALDLINIVPNPYYAFSTYETDKLDNRVKIINLPDVCDIKIYTINGSLIREFSKDDPTITSIDWDLKNHILVPISGGVYLIYVNVPNVGTRVLKWFGVLRPVDLDSF